MPETKENSRIVMLAIAFAVAVIVSVLYNNGTMRNLELLTLDYRFLLNSSTPRASFDYQRLAISDGIKKLLADKERQEKLPPGVVFVDMPEAGSDIRTSLSLDECTDAAKILFAGGAEAVVINSLLPKPSGKGSGASLAGVISSSGAVYLPVLYEVGKEKTERLYAGDGISGVAEPWPLFIDLGVFLGHINAFADPDGKLRRVPAVIGYKGGGTYHLGLAAAFGMLGARAADVKFNSDDHTITLNLSRGRTISIPLEKDNQFIINWGAVEKKSLLHFTYKDIVEVYRMVQDKIRPATAMKVFDGKICILGTAESNNFTGKPPSINYNYSPASACGLIASSVLRHSFVRHVPKSFNVALIFLVSIVVGSSLVDRRLLSVMMTGVIGAGLLGAMYIYGFSSATYLIVAIVTAVPLGIFLARFRLFSGLLFTVFSVLCCLIVPAGLFKLFNLVMVTFYPIFAILLVFSSFYAYTHLMALLSNIRLFNLATKDGLTGLYNRRHFNLLIETELTHSRLHKGRNLSLVMCDIDNFKKLNDTHGHQAGDTILNEFAKIMKSKCRQSDMVCRYGGEEFVIILCGAGASEAFKVAESVRQAIAEKSFTFKGQHYSTSLSMGLVEYTKEKTKEELIEKADQALYKAKNQGKNCVVIFQ